LPSERPPGPARERPPAWRRAVAAARRLDPLALAARLTLCLLLYEPALVGSAWYARAPLRVLAIAGLVVPGWHRSAALWALVFAGFAAKTASDWHFQDNHVWLLAAWSLALAMGFADAEPARRIRLNARLLVGLSFAFALLWKVLLSPDFRSGAYFHFTLLTDPRFADAAVLLGGIDPEALRANRMVATGEAASAAAASASGAPLASTPALALVAQAITLWTLALEGLLALCFLWPSARGPARLRDAALLAFGATTYLLATVPTFGWTLLTLGLAQADPRSGRLRALYLAVLALVVLYANVPVLAFVRRLVGA